MNKKELLRNIQNPIMTHQRRRQGTSHQLDDNLFPLIELQPNLPPTQQGMRSKLSITGTVRL